MAGYKGSMIELFYKLKKWLKNNAIKINIDGIANICIGLFFLLFPCHQNGTEKLKGTEEDIIISLTSIPSRINTLWLVTESLLRQTYKPSRIILWLSREEFLNQKIPIKLRHQMRRGLEIHLVDNLRSYKKFYYTMKRYPNSTIVTVDDDVIYSQHMLERLIVVHSKYPYAVCCHRSRQIGVKHDGRLFRYEMWENSILSKRKIIEKPSLLTCPIGVGGVLIPRGTYDNEVLNKRIFMELAPQADDLWLKCHAVLRNVPTVQLSNSYGDVIGVSNTQRVALQNTNVLQMGNDRQIENLTKYYSIDWRKVKSDEKCRRISAN